MIAAGRMHGAAVKEQYIPCAKQHRGLGGDDGKGAISVWLNTALNRPDAMFRWEQVWFNRRVSGRGKC